MNTVCGVDGCKSGWFYFELTGSSFRYGVCKTFDELLICVPKSEIILVDIPIGLPTAKQAPRVCDVEARKLLGPRRSSVFSAPIREILEFKYYEKANIRSKELTGKGISKQSFAITPKIIEVDNLLRSNSKLCKIIYEAHPELCFFGLANGKSMKYNKKSQNGFIERLEILLKNWKPTEKALAEALLWCSNHSVRDDTVDALAMAIVATHPKSEIVTIPRKIQQDKYGLPMQMIYPLTKKSL